MEVSLDTAIELYKKMLLLRRFEERVGRLARRDEVCGFVHTYVGEEAVAVGVCAHLTEPDVIFSTHRGHGHALAKGCDPGRVMAELAGKATGYCGGRGGSMHLYAPEVGFMGTNGMVAASIPLALGGAYSAKLLRPGCVSVGFFGDGASNHGAFHEALNMAAAWSLPAIFVCENNLYATETPLSSVTRVPDIAARAVAYGMPGAAVDGNDVLAVYAAAKEAIARARSGEGPTLLECRTYRVVGHHERGPVVGRYRTREEVDAWKERCPVRRLREVLLAEDPGLAEWLDALDRETGETVERAAAFAAESPYPDETLDPSQAYAGGIAS